MLQKYAKSFATRLQRLQTQDLSVYFMPGKYSFYEKAVYVTIHCQNTFLKFCSFLGGWIFVLLGIFVVSLRKFFDHEPRLYRNHKCTRKGCLRCDGSADERGTDASSAGGFRACTRGALKTMAQGCRPRNPLPYNPF